MNIWNITGFFLLMAIMNVLLELLTDLWNYYDNDKEQKVQP